MTIWPYEVISLTQSEILSAVRDDKWQAFRLSLKGLSTKDKLKKLDTYYRKHTDRVNQVRVSNYINALLRGGQLIKRGRFVEVQR